MKFRPIVVTAGLAGLLVLAGCGGSGSQSGSEERAPSGVQQSAAASKAPMPAKSTNAADEEKDTTQAQISTFALDVDTASYGYARRTLKEGRWPEPGQVRPEEFVNSFRQDYAQPADDGFTVHVDGARLADEDQAVVRVGLQTREATSASRRPANLTFVVDVSGSMGEPGRLDLVKDALRTLLGQLSPGDQVSIVAFSDSAEVLASMTPLASRDELLSAVDELTVKGGTNLQAGLVEGFRQASQSFRPVATNRVILLSDGLANQGSTEWQAILDQVKEYAGKQITLLTVGVGRDYGDTLMEQLADNGDGMAIYVSTVEEANKAFTSQLPGNIELRARDAKAQVVFNPSVVEKYQLIGYENRAIAAQDFRDDTKDGGEIGPGHSVTALYSVRLKPGATGQLATATVRWQDPDTRSPSEASKSVDAGQLAPALWTKAPMRLQVDVVAAGFALYMRDNQKAFGLDLSSLAEQAQRLAQAVEDPMVTELSNLITQASAVR
ncbi:von Willebrand factor type A domain-containing protein [Nonomuraea sp. NPDC050556]|uniref:vWA domain-containing protein n=1 Tax=Nonomuraea sp. NPDC050556 TaxID=3364369 RepID=UPI00379AE3DF